MSSSSIVAPLFAVSEGHILYLIGYPEPGRTTVHDTSVSIDLETEPLKGGFLVKTLVLSIDPYLRGKMREATKTSYSVRTLR